MATVPQAALALKNVLLASDFSSCSDRALLHAVAAAHHYGSTLHVAHIVDPAALSFTPPDAYVGTPENAVLCTDLARADAERLLRDVLQRTHCQDVKCRTWVEIGGVGETLCTIIERQQMDLAVVGTHGRTGLRRLFMGSVAEEVFRHAPCPVLTVGPHSWRSDPQTVRLKHILFPTDLSRDSVTALPFVAEIARDFGARLTLLHALDRLTGEAACDRTRIVTALEHQMRELAASAGVMRGETAFHVDFGEVAETVIQTASRLEVDLVAFGLKAPDTFVDRLPWMHAYKIVCEVACPVLSLRGVSRR